MENIDRYLRWCEDQGIQFPKLKYPVSYYPGYLGCEATEHIHPGETIIQIPTHCLFTFNKAFRSEIQEVFTEPTFRPERPMFEDLVLVTYIIYEKHKGSNSAWHFFLEAQPEEASPLTRWSAEELHELQDPDLEYHVRLQQNYRKALHEEWKASLSQYSQFFTADMLEFAAFEWALGLLITRAFGKFAPSTTLAPLAEFLNHSNTDTY